MVRPARACHTADARGLLAGARATMTAMSEPLEPATPVGPWLRRSRRVAYQNPWITVWHDDVARPDGSPGIYGVVHFENRAVGVVVLDDEDNVLLVGQHRYTLDD